MFYLRMYMLVGVHVGGGKAQPWANFYSPIINLVYNRNWQTLKYDIKGTDTHSVCVAKLYAHNFPLFSDFWLLKGKGFWSNYSPRLFLFALIIRCNTFLPALVFWLRSRNVVKIRKSYWALLSSPTSSKIVCNSMWITAEKALFSKQ